MSFMGQDPGDLTQDQMWSRAACDCEGDNQCPDCHPDCKACNGRGYFGFGLSCDTCQGMGTLGWTQNEIDNEHERRGMEASEP